MSVEETNGWMIGKMMQFARYTEKLKSYCGFRLTIKEQQNILNGGCLTDRIINAACAILRKQFPGYGGLESTLLQQCTRGLANTTNAI